MTIYILWNEDGHLIGLYSRITNAIDFIKDQHETNYVKGSRHSEAKSIIGDWLYDLDLETSEGVRYRIEERRLDKG